MSQYLVPAIALPPPSFSNGGPPGYTNYQLFHNREFFTDSRTPYLRVFVRWDHLQPVQNANPATDNTNQVPGYGGGLTPALYMSYLNYMIGQARNDGRKIILTLCCYPDWANQARRQTGAMPAGQQPYNCPPDYVTSGTASAVGSPYDFIVWFLSLYYHPLLPVNPGISMEYFEVCNEPNATWWPDSSPKPQIAAGMMATARIRTALATLNLPVIAGPAVLDNVGGGSDWATFTSAVLGFFRDTGLPTDEFMVWTIHNYGDIKHARNEAAALIERLKSTRDLSGNVIWTGYPTGDPAHPGVFSTEGGYNLAVNEDPAHQAKALSDNWALMLATDGMLMVTNYQTWSNPAPVDCGLCAVWPGSGGAMGTAASYERPALATWAALFTTAPR